VGPRTAGHHPRDDSSPPWTANAPRSADDSFGRRRSPPHCRNTACGERLAKTLSQRVHECTACGFIRDLVSAALAAHTTLTDPNDPSTARLDTAQARNTQIVFSPGLQDALSSQPQRGARPTRGRAHAAAHQPGIPGRRTSARQNTVTRNVPTPDETRPASTRHKAHAGTARQPDPVPTAPGHAGTETASHINTG
jgi:ribosomal protein L37E